MADVRTLLEDEHAPEGEYTLVVGVANPDRVDQLMRTAVDLARAHDGGIRVVSVAHKPVTSPFLLFSTDRIKQEFADEQQVVLDRAVQAADRASVPVRRSLLVASDVADALLSVVDDVDADALLLGWQERSRPSDIVLGTTVDPLLRTAPCDVFVERVGTVADGVESVLLPTDGGPNIGPAIDLAGAIARANDATVTALSVVPPTADRDQRAEARAYVTDASNHLRDVSVTVDTVVREATDVAEEIVAATADHDVVTLGATRERSFRTPVVGSVAERVAHRAESPIVIAKGKSERSLLDRVLSRAVGNR